MSGYTLGHRPHGSVRNAFVPSSAADAYREAVAFLKARDWRRLPGKATRLVRSTGDVVAIEYHNTEVVTYHADGRIELDHGGWHSQTTKYKMLAYCRGINAWCQDSVLTVASRGSPVDPLVETAKLAVESTTGEPYIDGNQPALAFEHDTLVLWPDGVLALGEETHAQAVARIVAWRESPKPARTRKRAVDTAQLRLAIAC